MGNAAHAGSLVADGAGAPGDLQSTVPSAKWAFNVTPFDGWGPRRGKQQATAGWLAALPVFEPHWQVTSDHETVRMEYAAGEHTAQ